ncbi:tail fiber protein [Ensifer sp.]|jgi:hypothetical protein|uniref:tail fiber protein n=1 Tax=Ensifer sp. TaxID=1872086 RepID=UPI002E160228|nr:tail fiber protein [Ensifer sp.]
MPRTGGVYSPPAGTKGVPNTTIQSVPYNTLIDDLTADANAPRPVTAGGTGATSASGARAALGVEIGSTVQAYDAGLQSIAGLTTAADRMLYTTNADLYATTALTPFARDILGDSSAAAMKTRLGLAPIASSGSASDITTGTIADARLPGTMSSKTVLSTLIVATGTAGNGTANVSAGNATNTGYIDLRKGDGNRAGFIGYAAHAGGNIELNAEAGFRYNFSSVLGPTWNGAPLITTSGATFSGLVWGTTFIAQSDFQIRAAGDRFLWLMSNAGVSRGAILHNNAVGSIDLAMYNTSGTYVRNMSFRENGAAYWAGHHFEVGNNAGAAEFRLHANLNRNHRLLSDSGGAFYLQYSNNAWASAATLAWWDSAANANFGGSIYSPSGFYTAAGLGGGNGVISGNIDGATYVGHNLRISSWWGVGFWDYSSGACRVVVNTRTGEISALGALSLGSARVFTDGNIQFAGTMAGFGTYLSDALSQRAVVYTGSNANETNFPLGHVISVLSMHTVPRNGAMTVYVRTANNIDYTTFPADAPGGTLAGTWRTRGRMTGDNGIMQRTA